MSLWNYPNYFLLSFSLSILISFYKTPDIIFNLFCFFHLPTLVFLAKHFKRDWSALIITKCAAVRYTSVSMFEANQEAFSFYHLFHLLPNVMKFVYIQNDDHNTYPRIFKFESVSGSAARWHCPQKWEGSRGIRVSHNRNPLPSAAHLSVSLEPTGRADREYISSDYYLFKGRSRVEHSVRSVSWHIDSTGEFYT